MKCLFCMAEAKLSKEHFLSKPICAATGIDRSGLLVASVDGRTNEVGHASPLSSRSIRLPCSACNSGWMSDLENDAADTIQRWCGVPGEPLTQAGLTHLARWSAKTAIVLSFAENDSRRFLDEPEDAAVPAVTLAKDIAQGKVPDSVVVGAARTATGAFVWGVGNPTVDPVGADRISSRAVNVAAFNLGPLQLWVVMPFIQPDRLILPRGVVRLDPQLTFGTLTIRNGDLDPTQVIAEYSDETTTAFQAAIANLLDRAAAPPSA